MVRPEATGQDCMSAHECYELYKIPHSKNINVLELVGIFTPNSFRAVESKERDDDSVALGNPAYINLDSERLSGVDFCNFPPNRVLKRTVPIFDRSGKGYGVAYNRLS
jgi:hypothetical protein